MAASRLAPGLLLALIPCGLLALGIAFVATAAPQPGGPAPSANAAADPFASWPKDTKPEAVLVITGQTYGYLQPCGCSRPQIGGLERRANFMKAIKARGWPVAGLDLGDILPVVGIVPEQVVLKYATTLPALRDMGYLAVGAGKAEFTNGLFQILNQYAGKKEQPPYLLAGNVAASFGGKITRREDAFPGPGTRSMVGLVEVAEVGGTPVGVASVVGPSVQKAVAALGAKALVAFTPEKDALTEAVKLLADHAKKPQVNVLLYQGTVEEAKAIAKDFPQFRVVTALSADSEPPETAETITHADGRQTLILQVGHKGRYVGVVGVFRGAEGKLDLRYTLVSLGEEYITPGTEAEARQANPALPLLEEFAAQVKSRNLLGKFPEYPAPGQAQTPKVNLTYIGSEACKKCHEAEYTKWQQTPHSHAFDTLEKTAKRPSLRQFDGECVICHTVGLGYKSGFRSDLTTPHLKHVGCESCHGPGSGHSADPKEPTLLALQSPWRKEAGDRLPDIATIEKLAAITPAQRDAVPLTAGQKRALTGVSNMCAGCHDTENDPRFDLVKYWPKVAHPTPAPKK